MTPKGMADPFSLPPHPWAQAAAEELMNKVRAYMRATPESELHRQGKMFGVLVVGTSPTGNEDSIGYIAAHSAQLDGCNAQKGFVPPIYAAPTLPTGGSQEESRRLQRLLFAKYQLLNGYGETRDLISIFSTEKPILSAEEWFGGVKNAEPKEEKRETLPPSGAGECCAPKLLQYALSKGWKPMALAEFWMGAPPRNELRAEGHYYTPCSGKCVPILRHMLRGTAIAVSARQTAAEELCKRIETVYEDEYLMVVNKPAGLLSVRGRTDEPSIESYLSQQCGGGELQPVHRLDKDTSGLLVLAKDADVYRRLQAYFQRRDILKRYEAVLSRPADGVSIPTDGEISLPLLPNPFDRPRQMVDFVHGKPSLTVYHVRERRTDGTIFVDFYPHTGRTHQLRVHAAHPEGLDCPIAGDRLYGTPGERLMLHAAEIRFVHPITNEEMHFCIPSGF